MIRSPTDIKFDHLFSLFLAVLAAADDEQTLLIEAGTLDCVKSIMRRHEKVPSLQEKGCVLIQLLADKEVILQNKDLCSNIIKVVLDAMIR